MWFGARPCLPIPDISSYPTPTRATHNAEALLAVRKTHHVLPPATFTKLKTLEEVVTQLFGEIRAG